ncbi:MAG: hypothetical protein WCJ19_06070 [bacterium]
MDDQISQKTMQNVDPLLIQEYIGDVIFPISQEDLMTVVRSNNARQEIIEQMEEMLQSDIFYSIDQIFNELGGMYNDGEAVSMDNEDFGNS